MYGNTGIPYGVDLVDALASLVTLTAHPVPVQIGAHAVQHFTGELVLLPLLGVELEHALIHQVLSVLQHKGTNNTGIGSRWRCYTSQVGSNSIFSRQASLARQAFLITPLHGARYKTGKNAYAKK